MKGKWLYIAAGIALAIGCVVFYNWLSVNRIPNFKRDCVLYVYPGDDIDTVLTRLEKLADIKREESMEYNVRKAGGVRCGKYQIKREYTTAYVARMLSHGWQTPQNLVFAGTIRTKARLAGIISSQMLVDSLTVADSLSSETFLAAYGVTPSTVFSIILPDTYQMYWTDPIDKIMARMKMESDRFWTKRRKESAAAQGLTPLQAYTLASIVIGETKKETEFPKIAGVYLNRYHKGMKLQADPTVCYCYDYKLTRVLKCHLKTNSPYNTYKYAGLPPGPISVAPKACIDAVLNPAAGKYLYFCASPDFDGTHRFAVTYAEHRQNARAFQRALNAKIKEREKCQK